MLTDQQIDHFETFGFLFLPRLFPPAEIAEIRLAADALWRDERGGGPDQGQYQHVAPFIESSRDLSRLLEDDRIYLTIEKLLGAGFVWGGSEGNKGSFNETQSHGWHCDRPGEDEAGLCTHQGDAVPDTHGEGDGSVTGDARFASPALL